MRLGPSTGFSKSSSAQRRSGLLPRQRWKPDCYFELDLFAIQHRQRPLHNLIYPTMAALQENHQQVTSVLTHCAAETPDSCRASFERLLRNIQKSNWKIHLNDLIRKYSLESYKLATLSPKSVLKIYSKISLKYDQVSGQRMNWFQNQLRIFVWILAASPSIFNFPVTSYTQHEIGLIAQPFFGIPSDLCDYQYKSVICPQLFRGWEVDENQLLSEILKRYNFEGSWSTIAKQLFLESGKKFFRTPQTCRERWQNHLDQRKIRGKWTNEDDYLLIKFILSEGKRWSVIAKKFGDTRTEHMVKNRFQTIVKRESTKRYVKQSEEHQFCRDLLKKLQLKIAGDSTCSNSHITPPAETRPEESFLAPINETSPLIPVSSYSPSMTLFKKKGVSFMEQQDFMQQNSIQLFDLQDNCSDIDNYWKEKMSHTCIGTTISIPLFVDDCMFSEDSEKMDLMSKLLMDSALF